MDTQQTTINLDEMRQGRYRSAKEYLYQWKRRRANDILRELRTDSTAPQTQAQRDAA